MARGATIRDVAARARVSIATVSRVLNGTGLVTPETEERVRSAVAELDFRLNIIGRNLKSARTRMVGVLIPTLSNPAFAENVAGIQEAAAEAGYSVLITSTGYSNDRENHAMESLLSNQVEGLVVAVADADNSPLLDRLDRIGTAYVLTGSQPKLGARAFVSVDHVAAARAIAERMIALGHRDIAMVAEGLRQADRARLLYAGYCATMRAAALQPAPVIEVDFTNAGLAQQLAPYFDGLRRTTALLISDDLLALATIQTLRELGLSVPNDVSVTGFDGIEVGTLVSPSLATVVQPAREMGRTAFTTLLARLGNTAHEVCTTLPFIIRDGGTLGPVPSRMVPITLAEAMQQAVPP